MVGIVLFIVFALLVVASLVFSIIKTREVMLNDVTKIDFQTYFITNGITGGVFALSLMAMFLSIYGWAGISPQLLEVIQTIFGALGFGILGFISLHTFLLHYYGKKIPENIDKAFFIALMIAFPVMFLSIFLLSNGFADYLNLTGPLVSGLSWNDGFVTPYSGKPNLAFYALCIVSGAIYVYLYADHKYYLQYGKHGVLESTFYVAFPAGVIGARLWYCVGLWDQYKDNLGQIFNMQEGGLTILGGAITGIVVGVLWFKWRNKGYSLALAFDIVVPSILIAQTVGRWGNFFNCEVHGVAVSEEYWRWLPKVIFNNAHFSDAAGTAPAGQLYVPLFFIEGITNLLGFFVLAHVFGNRLRKYTELGDLGYGYIIWYGLTRVLLEPIRYSNYKMGFWSWFWSFAFLIVGSLLIVGNHLIRRIIRKKKGTFQAQPNDFMVGLISTIAIGVIGTSLAVVGAILMSQGTFDKSEPLLNTFNIGLICASFAISILLGLAISIPKMLDANK